MVFEPDRAAVMVQAARILAGEVVPALEHRILHRDGSLRWVRNTSVPRFDERRRLIAYDGLIADITKRKRAEELLRHSEQRYRDIFDNVLDGLYLLDVTAEGLFRILEVNPALERLTVGFHTDLTFHF